ncbi:hypothetical protein MMC11_007631 [Xylographa trunciseda]|nr:hypothetical protein [Xylographa trunciseda]
MHFSKFFSSLLAAGALVVPSLGYAENEYHLARRWVDQEREDLQVAIRSLDKGWALARRDLDAEWALERRDLEVELRSLDPRGQVLLARASAAKSKTRAPSHTPAPSSNGEGRPGTGAHTSDAKAPSHTPAPSSGGEGNPATGAHTSDIEAPSQTPAPSSGGEGNPATGGHASHNVAPNVCNPTPSQTKISKRSLARRAEIKVQAGYSESGGSSDQLATWGLKTCIGIAATTGGGKKALAHINGINGNQEDYNVQLTYFGNLLNSLGGPWKLAVSFPSPEEGPSVLHATLGDMIMEAETVAARIDSGYKSVDRARGASGFLVIRPDNSVQEC